MSESIEQSFTLHVPSSNENLAMIRSFVNEIAKRVSLSDEEAALLAVAVDEASANVIEHAYGHDASKQVTVRATIDDEQIRIDVIDQGKGFDPDMIERKDPRLLIKERASGGLGMGLIQRIMDEVKYHVVPGEKNELKMIKKRHKPA
ncbi:MAG: ATP-binding protein [Bryobacterales bacterium]|nr:ATP-binding protein [Bryobacterales bacterium]MCC7340014.1 ATP-binding protein [Bryobacterales bacterium]